MNSETFSTPVNLFEERLNELFKKKTTVRESDQVLLLVSMILLDNPNNTDLVDTYNLLGLEDFVKLVHLFDGRTVRFPTSGEIQEMIVLAFCYYYREVRGLDWDEIRAILPWDISSVSYGSRVKKLSAFIRGKITEIMNDTVKEVVK